jgi:uncharacterized protein YjiS (DUF1127 family)
MEIEKMAARLDVQNDVIRRDRARWHGMPDHLVRTAEMRRRQAEAITNGAHWVWTLAARAVRRLANAVGRARTPAADRKEIARTLGRASLADAFRRDRERVARLFRLILEPFARRRRRRIAIDRLSMLDDRLLADIGLRRGQIELAVDGKLLQRDQTRPPAAGTSLPAEEDRYELPLAA